MRLARSGFTLIEIMLAMVILASGIVLLAQSWGSSYMRIRKTQLNVEVAALLERKMVEIDIKYHGKALETIPEEEGDDFGSDYPQYRWVMKSKEFELPDLSTGMTDKSGGANSMLLTIMKTLTEQLKKTVKEVKVSVFYKKAGAKELEFSVTTFFVDYNKQVAMPGAG